MWCVWKATGTSLAEIETRWTVGDLVTAVWYLEAQNLIEEANRPKGRK